MKKFRILKVHFTDNWEPKFDTPTERVTYMDANGSIVDEAPIRLFEDYDSFEDAEARIELRLLSSPKECYTIIPYIYK